MPISAASSSSSCFSQSFTSLVSIYNHSTENSFVDNALDWSGKYCSIVESSSSKNSIESGESDSEGEVGSLENLSQQNRSPPNSGVFQRFSVSCYPVQASLPCPERKYVLLSSLSANNIYFTSPRYTINNELTKSLPNIIDKFDDLTEGNRHGSVISLENSYLGSCDSIYSTSEFTNNVYGTNYYSEDESYRSLSSGSAKSSTEYLNLTDSINGFLDNVDEDFECCSCSLCKCRSCGCCLCAKETKEYKRRQEILWYTWFLR